MMHRAHHATLVLSVQGWRDCFFTPLDLCGRSRMASAC